MVRTTTAPAAPMTGGQRFGGSGCRFGGSTIVGCVDNDNGNEW